MQHPRKYPPAKGATSLVKTNNQTAIPEDTEVTGLFDFYTATCFNDARNLGAAVGGSRMKHPAQIPSCETTEIVPSP
jgi:hypothetical protein